MKYLYLLLFASLLLSSSCKEDKKDKIAHLVTEWQGKEIVFPQDMVFTRYAKDTMEQAISNTPYKILVYVDSIGCTSCKLQLPRWKELIAYTDSMFNQKVSYLFFFHAKDYKEIRYLLKRDMFDFPVCLDKEDQLNKLNQFPADITFQTFLLDSDNKVSVIGNPIHNLAVKDLYLQQLAGKDVSTPQSIKTTAEVVTPEINLGTFGLSETKKAKFTIKNSGNNPLVILDVSTTCGCAVATFDKQPAKTGETLQVNVEITPKDTGSFDETITVKCNTQQFIKLKIKGQTQ